MAQEIIQLAHSTAHTHYSHNKEVFNMPVKYFVISPLIVLFKIVRSLNNKLLLIDTYLSSSQYLRCLFLYDLQQQNMHKTRMTRRRTRIKKPPTAAAISSSIELVSVSTKKGYYEVTYF